MHLLGMFDQVPVSPMESAVAGSYSAEINGVECVVKLWFNPEGFLHGLFVVEGETLEMRGGFSSGDRVYGFLLERYQHVPLAFFDGQILEHGLQLRLGVPDFSTVLNHSEAEQVLFARAVLGGVVSYAV